MYTPTLSDIQHAQRALESQGVHQEIINICSDLLFGLKIQDWIKQSGRTTKNQLSKLRKLAEQTETVIETPKQYFEFVLTSMMSEAREQTSGACRLAKVLVPKDVYREYLQKFGLNAGSDSVVFQKCILEPCEELNYGELIGLCTTKFRHIPASMLIVKARLTG